MGKDKSISIENWNKTRIASHNIPVQHRTTNPGQKKNKARDRSKRNPNSKRRSKTIPIFR